MSTDVDNFFREGLDVYENNLNKGFFERWVTARKGKIPTHFISPNAIPVDPDHNAYFKSKMEIGSDYKTFLSLGYGWRYGKTTIKASAGLIELLSQTPASDLIPASWLDAIPGWTTFIPLQDEPDAPGVFFGLRKYGEQKVLLVGSAWDEMYRISAYDLQDEEDGFVSFKFPEWFLKDTSKEDIELTKSHLNAILFLCTLIPHQPAAVKVPKRITGSKKVTYAMSPRKHNVINLESAVDKYLKEYDTDTRTLVLNQRKAHMRRAHWRTYWTGPRNGEQVKVLRWIPPTFVKGFVAE